MADTKITGLQTPQVTTNPATDVLPIVNIADNSMAASGSTRKITVNQLLGAGGTATLASATITGDLTVDTSTLKVDSANNRVGIQVASPSDTLDIGANDGTAKSIALRYSTLPLFLSSTFDGTNGINTLSINNKNISTGSASWASAINTTYGSSAIQTLSYIGGGEVRMFTSSSSNAVPSERYRIDNTGVSTWSVGGSTAMTLNSTGLGVGVSPSFKLHVQENSTNVIARFNGSNANGSVIDIINTGAGGGSYKIGSNFTVGGAGEFAIYDTTAAATRFLISSTGNVGVGVTPSARLDVQTATGDCSARVKSNAAGSNATFIIDYVDSYGTHVIRKSGTDVWLSGVIADTGATPNYKIQNASAVGVQLVSGATAWTTLSDETMKDIIEPISNAVAKVGSLRSVIGKFKTDDSNKRRSFLIAQDVQSVLPEAVDVVGENNELGLRYTEVIPLLVAAIKELTAEVNALKNA